MPLLENRLFFLLHILIFLFVLVLLSVSIIAKRRQMLVDIIDQSTKEHVTECRFKWCETVYVLQEVHQLGSDEKYEDNEIGDVLVKRKHAVEIQQKEYRCHKGCFCCATKYKHDIIH
jgi:hypothetical protein